MDNIVVYTLLIIAFLLIIWIKIKSTDQNQLRAKLIATLLNSNQLLQLLQSRRVLMTDTNKNLSQNEIKLIGNNADIEKLLYSLDTDKAILSNDYWSGFLDHWKRMKSKGFATSKAILYQQHSNLINNILLLQKDRLHQAESQELLAEAYWLSDCIWTGLAEIIEHMQRIVWLCKPSNPALNSTISPAELMETRFNIFDALVKQWLLPLNQKGIPLDPNLIIRTLSSCERAIRVYKQEIVAAKNSSYSPQSFTVILNETLSNLHSLQSQMINHLKRRYQIR